jgi:hypothetical protein
MDVVQKVKDLSQLAFDERGNSNERLQVALAALRLVEAYLLPKGKKKIDVAAEIINKITSPDFAEEVASRVEKFAEGFDRVLGSAGRVLGSAKMVSDHLSKSGVDAAPASGRKGGKRKYSGR